MTYYATIETGIGPILLTSDGTSLTGLYPEEHKRARIIPKDWQQDNSLPIFEETSRQLASYLAGELRQFDLPLALNGTSFQTRIWEELQQIPYGATTTYGDLAQVIGNSRAAQATGAAVGANPLSIVVPCHRVVGANGSLTGYAGGLGMKKMLLELEGSNEKKHLRAALWDRRCSIQ